MSARRPIIAANWKMHHDHLEAIQVVQKLSYRLEEADYEACDVVVCPPFTDLRTLQTLTEGDKIPIALGAQNCHWEDNGAVTGEISPPMLAKLRCSYVIVGHSERRQLFGETDEIVNRKAKAVFANGMVPIVCVGETLEQRDAGQAQAVVEAQVRGSLAGFTKDQAAEVVVAYEPVWAIGTGKTATSEDANDMCGHVRRTIAALHGDKAADAVRIQYGGSVKPGNVVDLMRQPEIDGALVGGASLDAEDFAVICRYHRF